MANNDSRKRKLWMGSAALVVLAAGVVIGGRYLTSNPHQTAGTIVPADRYRAPQIAGKDVNLGNQTIPTMMQTDSFEATSSGHSTGYVATASSQAAADAASNSASNAGNAVITPARSSSARTAISTFPPATTRIPAANPTAMRRSTSVPDATRTMRRRARPTPTTCAEKSCAFDRRRMAATPFPTAICFLKTVRRGDRRFS